MILERCNKSVERRNTTVVEHENIQNCSRFSTEGGKERERESEREWKQQKIRKRKKNDSQKCVLFFALLLCDASFTGKHHTRVFTFPFSVGKLSKCNFKKGASFFFACALYIFIELPVNHHPQSRCFRGGGFFFNWRVDTSARSPGNRSVSTAGKAFWTAVTRPRLLSFQRREPFDLN